MHKRNVDKFHRILITAIIIILIYTSVKFDLFSPEESQKPTISVNPNSKYTRNDFLTQKGNSALSTFSINDIGYKNKIIKNAEKLYLPEKILWMADRGYFYDANGNKLNEYYVSMTTEELKNLSKTDVIASQTLAERLIEEDLDEIHKNPEIFDEVVSLLNHGIINGYTSSITYMISLMTDKSLMYGQVGFGYVDGRRFTRLENHADDAWVYLHLLEMRGDPSSETMRSTLETGLKIPTERNILAMGRAASMLNEINSHRSSMGSSPLENGIPDYIK